MALHTELPVYRATYKLVLEIFVSTKSFPKEYKYSLGRDMERDVLVLMRCIYRANRAQEKTTFLNEFLDNFEILKLEIRVCAANYWSSPENDTNNAYNFNNFNKSNVRAVRAF
jgi:hypothetical protein